MKKVKNNLKYWIEKIPELKGLKKYEKAQFFGITPTLYHYYVTNQKQPKYSNMIYLRNLICKSLGMEVEGLPIEELFFIA
jgi:hypothetical protein